MKPCQKLHPKTPNTNNASAAYISISHPLDTSSPP
eukprot:COSAG02_NODE_14752_length_1239_cov_193.723684_1_plen_34_part_10